MTTTPNTPAPSFKDDGFAAVRCVGVNQIRQDCCHLCRSVELPYLCGLSLLCELRAPAGTPRGGKESCSGLSRVILRSWLLVSNVKFWGIEVAMVLVVETVDRNRTPNWKRSALNATFTFMVRRRYLDVALSHSAS